jgi:hypothetical protein
MQIDTLKNTSITPSVIVILILTLKSLDYCKYIYVELNQNRII